MRMAGGLHPSPGPVELPALAPSRRAKRRGKHTGPEPALRPGRAGSDGRPGAPAWQRERFAAVAPASRALSIERPQCPHRRGTGCLHTGGSPYLRFLASLGASDTGG